MPVTKFQKHLRKLSTDRIPFYDFIDPQLITLSETLHPKDVETLLSSLLNPSSSYKLSNISQFVTIEIPSPSNKPVIIVQKDLEFEGTALDLSNNPCQHLYHELAHAQGPGKNSLLKDVNITETFNAIKALPPLAELLPQQRSFLYIHYGHCFSDPALIPALLRSVNWDEIEESKKITEQLKDCQPLEIEYALEFFTPRYEQQPIREFAVRCISVIPRSELILYIPQLLQAIKAKYTDGLSTILIRHASEDITFASTVYWNAKIESNESEEINTFLSELMKTVPTEIRLSLEDQNWLVQNIFDFLTAAQKNNRTPHAVRNKAIELLTTETSFSTNLIHFKKIRLPLDPTKVAVGIDPNDVKVFQSKLKPVMLTFILDNGSRYRVIFKIGDDMRQDQLIIQLFKVMGHIFELASLPLPITAYSTLAFSPSFGCCEFIENSRAIRDIKDTKNGPTTIRGFLEEGDGPIEPKIEIFTKSLAAYCVMTYVLKIGDRHDNNILVTRDGRLLHIDYGYILGDVTKPFTPPLKLSNEMIDTIGENGLERVCSWAGPAFNSLRKRARLILVLIELMFTAPLQCFKQNPMRRLQQVENTLLMNCTEIEAINSLLAVFSESLNSKMQVLWDAVHVMALGTTTSATGND
ncbi:Phosphatidylinositol 3- and 4-kinase family protein [Histomonas meleagridis]|uniref:Phosphatidylinositol 3- and 4-kinase family protein n=1 Tax=Histomonas meleagridis TaxID=135588 RepID=UPI003559D2CA|nr:Phosphatidylinositol 3- and 4-kinase family protein [Histomonas meleagridis]KAH0801388.1 Phosphatidylinositol 3- and 4-kinase family protein [Histomonas meleagridis]